MSKTEGALKEIKNLYSKGGIVNLAEHPRYPTKILTGRPSIDYVTDGGIPTGRLILLAGEKSSGKSTFAMQVSNIMAKKILYVDTEYTLTTDYLEQLGCDPSKFFHTMPESTEKMCDIIRANVDKYDVIIIDSINNSASEEQLDKNSDQKTMANRASVLSVQLPIIVGMCNQHNTTLFVISQIRQNLDKKTKYDPDNKIPGGESLHHNSSMTIEFTGSTKLKEEGGNEFEDKETVGGRVVNINCTKNKVGEPFKKVKIEFNFGTGYTEENDVIAAAQRLDVITSSGAWLYYKDYKWNGKEKMKQAIKEDQTLYTEIKDSVQEKMELVLE